MDLEFTKIDPIRNHVFFKIDDFKFNVKILNCDDRLLNGNELEKFVENFKVADGYYKIKGALYDKSKAIETIQKSYKVYNISIKFKSMISEDSGFIVNFDYNKRS